MRVTNPRLNELFKTPQRRTYTISALTTITVGVFLVLALRPTFLRIADLNKEIEDQRTFLAKIDAKLQTVNDLIAQKQSVSEEIAVFEDSFSVEDKRGFVVANLGAIAEKYDLYLNTVDFDDELGDDFAIDIDNPEDVSAVQVDISVEGTYPNIQRYIDYLEGFPKIFDIINLGYAKQDVAQYDGDLAKFKPIRATMSMYMYLWNGEEIFADTEETN